MILTVSEKGIYNIYYDNGAALFNVKDDVILNNGLNKDEAIPLEEYLDEGIIESEVIEEVVSYE